MNFWIFMVCVAIAMLLGAALERAKTKMETKTSKNKAYKYAEVCFKDINIPRSVMRELSKLVEKNGVIRVYDYYLICGVGSSSEDAKYGWKSIENFSIEQIEDHYVLRVPVPSLLEK